MACTREDCRGHLIDAIPARLACYDKERRVIWINRYSAEMLGAEAEELVGRTCCEIWQRCRQPVLQCHLIKSIQTGMPQQAEVTTAQGTVWSLMAFPYHDERGELVCIAEYGHDVTTAKRLKELEDDVNAMTRHDLRSPAIAALNVVQLLKKADNLTTDQRDLLDELHRSGRHMLETINQTLALRQIEQGGFEPALRTVDCVELAREVRASFQGGRTAQSRIRIYRDGLEVGGNVACHVVAEENLLRTALMNIVKNACEASPSGEDVAIELECEEGVTIRVRNKGAVPREIRDAFFGKYVTCGKKSGTGLGAYSARKMIEAQNASIAMRTSDEDGGETEITISF